MTTRLDELLSELDSIVINLKKSPERTYSQKFLNEKQILLETSNYEFKTILKSIFVVDKELAVKYKEKYTGLRKKIKDILSKSLADPGTSKEDDKDLTEVNPPVQSSTQTIKEYSTNNVIEKLKSNMTTFDIASAIKIIPEFQGDREKLDNFLNLIELINEGLRDDIEKEKLIRFVLKTRLADKVKNKLSTQDTAQNFETLKKTLNDIFKSNKTPLKIHAELCKVFQANKSVTEFASKIEYLTAQLNKLQIAEQGDEHRQIIARLNDQIALNSFKNGLNESLKSTIFAARPKNLHEAVQIATEAETPNREVSINFYERNRFQQRKYNNTNRNYYNRNSNDKNMRYSNKKDNRNNQHSANNRYNRHNNSNNRNRNTNRRINITHSGNEDVPEGLESGNMNIN